ncbi:NUDIX hydrolase [Microbacterium sp. SD291]|uniref:NUDIX hydrolase n=1 Tax=Microbacterium sp. SD291 TaxID=2782007 RepID=UPI001A95AC31|nr:NUDIX hydrolase [Microbacterium sp. SD291]MBO0980555.1 NUDIX hydrolase [Microbacterium sp. SD291]
MSALEDLPVAGTVVLLRTAADGFEVLLIRRPARGSFAGAWVFPGGKVEEDDRAPGASEVDDARRAGIRETAEEVGLAVEDLVELSQWHPPAEAPTRIRTWFFLARAPQGELRISDDEVAEAAWISPGEALARQITGEWMLFPPTWVTLHQLSAFADAGSALAAAGVARLFETRVVETPAGRVFRWGDARLETGVLPWRFVSG